MAMILMGGSAANPPTIGHRKMLEVVAQYGAVYGAKKVLWIPSGIRSDKEMLPSALRREMIELTLPSWWFAQRPVPVEIDWRDIDGSNTPTYDVFHWAFRAFPRDDIVWYTGSDSVSLVRDSGGLCEIQECWKKGEKMFRVTHYHFLIVSRKGWERDSCVKFPRHFVWLDADIPEISSTQVRETVRNGRVLPEGWLAPGVEDLLKTHYSQEEIVA